VPDDRPLAAGAEGARRDDGEATGDAVDGNVGEAAERHTEDERQGQHERLRRLQGRVRASRAPAHMASRGAVRPVKISKDNAACCTSMPNPPKALAPALDAA